MGRKKGSTNKKMKVENYDASTLIVDIKGTPKVEEVKVETPKPLIVGQITDDFGREDLNRFRDRFNELVEKLSK